jgi:hypothetical protein
MLWSRVVPERARNPERSLQSFRMSSLCPFEAIGTRWSTSPPTLAGSRFLPTMPRAAIRRQHDETFSFQRQGCLIDCVFVRNRPRNVQP